MAPENKKFPEIFLPSRSIKYDRGPYKNRAFPFRVENRLEIQIYRLRYKTYAKIGINENVRFSTFLIFLNNFALSKPEEVFEVLFHIEWKSGGKEISGNFLFSGS